MTANTRARNSRGTRAWNKSLIEFTKMRRGFFQRSGSVRASGWTVRPKPGPEVRGSPSFWYLACPMPLRRLAMVRA
jgi:hypothetical protein